MCFAPQRRALFRHLNFQKWSDAGVFCYILTSKMCFAPQRSATLFRHLNFQKWSGCWCVLYILTSKCASRHNGVHFFDISTSKSGPDLVCFVHFDFNVLRATTACTFSTSQLPKVVRSWCVLYILTSKCASRHNGVHFFISHLASWLRARRFSEPYFSTLRSPKSLEKHSESRLSYLFAHLHLLSSDLVSSDSSHLCFSTVHIVGSFTSKLPSNNY